MIRTTLDQAYIKRTIRPNYGWDQATPKSCFLDPLWDKNVDIYPGMVMSRTDGENYTLIGPGMQPSGFSALFVGGYGIDEVEEAGINAFSVWALGSEAEFEILSPAFDTGAAWADPGNGTDLLLHAYVDGVNRGKLAPAGTTGRGTLSTLPAGRLLKVVSASKIVVGGLRGTV